MERRNQECPKCKEETMTVKTWSDDYGIEEEYKHCPCGYFYHWAYGVEYKGECDQHGRLYSKTTER